MLFIATNSGKFSDEEMKNLDNDTEIFSLEGFSFFTRNQHLDTDFYPTVWKLLQGHFTEKYERQYIPRAFIKSIKLVLSISHGQATVEHSFSETKM